jgi:dTDP-4-dehydrorhamnose 3,5-epimerase
MEIVKTRLEGLVQLKPKIFPDERGRFFEAWSDARFKEMGLNMNFVQDNHSFSRKGVLRGLHLQNPPFEQGKLVFVVSGKALDVAVDVRKNSSTYGKFEVFLLEGDKANMVYIPPGFAHGFLTLEETNLTYKCTNYYNSESESGILWNDPELGIDWGVEKPMISEKDTALSKFSEFKSYF